MDFQKIIGLIENHPLLVTVVGGLLILIIAGLWRFVWRKHKSEQQPPTPKPPPLPPPGGGGPPQEIIGPEGKAQYFFGPGCNVTIYNYQDGVAKSLIKEVRDEFQQGLYSYQESDFSSAIKHFLEALDNEDDPQKRGALFIQIGNSHYFRYEYDQAYDAFASALEEAEKADDVEGRSSALCGTATVFISRPTFDADQRENHLQKAIGLYSRALELLKDRDYPLLFAQINNDLGVAYGNLRATSNEEWIRNAQKAIDCFSTAHQFLKSSKHPILYATVRMNYGTLFLDMPAQTKEIRIKNIHNAIVLFREALKIRTRDEFPIDFAALQVNIGLAYISLSDVVYEERERNILIAIGCYKKALEIFDREKHSHYFAHAAANLGIALAYANNREACRWLKNAFELRNYLPDQGERVGSLIEELCKDKPNE